MKLNGIFCLLVAMGWMFMGEGNAQPTSGGPDAFGYTWKSSAHASGPVAKWIELTNSSKYPGVLDLTDKFDDDNFFGPLNYSFDFPYYWYTRREMYIGSNGYICFNPQNISASFPAIPQVGGSGDDYMAPFTADLTLAGETNQGKVYFYTDFKDTVVVSWENVPWFDPATGLSGRNSFQIVLSRPDSSITYNYATQVGGPSNSQTSNFLSIGIENVSGQVGLQVARDLTALQMFPIGMSKTAPFSIRFYKPVSSTFSVRDLRALWNNSPGNRGAFFSMNGKPVPLRSYVYNQGLEEGPKVPLKGEIRSGAAPTSVTINTNKIPIGQGEVYVFKDLVLPVTAEGQWTFTQTVQYTDDQILNNNNIPALIKIVDTTKAEMELRYDDKTREDAITWVGGSNYNSGMGTYIEPPFYPIKLKAITFNGTGEAGAPPAGGMRVQAFDDDGVNLRGERDGSPGTLLAQADIVPINSGENRFNLTTPIQINSGGIYLAMLQQVTGVFFGMDNTPPHSYTTFEVINGSFVPYRSQTSTDAMIGMVIEKGDLNNTLDIGVSRIVTPDSCTTAYTDSVEVEIELKNYGPKQVTGPFEVAYRANLRAEIFETIPGTFTLAPGATTMYKFKKKTARPPAPKTKFDMFCARTLMPNDFVDLNNKLCVECGEPKDTTSIGQIQGGGTYRLYPNPASERVLVEVMGTEPGWAYLELLDLNGRLIQKTEPLMGRSSGFTMELAWENMESGLYLIRIHSAGKTITDKIRISQ